MRRLFKYGIIMCVLLSAGCVAGMKTDRVPVDIGFNPVIGHDVRASEESIPFPEDWTFNVWATKSSDGATHMDDVTLAYGPQGWVADAQWPDCPLIFAAYYPSALQPEYSPGHGIIIRNFNASSDDNDVLVAMEAEYECDADVLVPLHFEHILSRVDFRVRHSLAQDIEVFAKKVVIKGFDLTGDYNLAGDHKWTVGAKDGSITAYDAGETQGLKITDVAQYVGDEYFIIPQHCKGEIIVTFNVRVGNGGWVVDEVSTGSLDSDWQPGKQYTYTLNLTDTHMTYTTGISSWENRNE